MSAKDWFHHVTHDVKHAADHAGDAIKHGAEDTGKGIADQGKDIAHGDFDKAGHDAKHDASAASTHARHSADAISKDVEDAIVTTLSDVQNLWNKAKHDLEAAEHKALGSLEAKRKEAWNSLNAMKHSVSHDLEVLEDGAKADISKAADASKKTLESWADDEKIAWQQVGHDIKEDIESAASSKVAELTAEGVHKGLKEADALIKKIDGILGKFADSHPALVAHLNSIGDDINLGPLKLSYANFYSRAQEIGDALDKTLGGDFHLTQTFINDLVRGLGPDSVTVDADIEFFSTFGDDLKTIPLDVFVEIADIIMDALKVPK